MSAAFSPTPEVVCAQTMMQHLNEELSRMVANYMTHYNAVWKNPAATPDKIVAAFGSQGQALFAKAAATAAYLVAMGAVDATGKPTIPTTMPTGWNYVANADGSVTLTKTA